MDAKQIISKIESGDYKIEYAEECNCSGIWSVERGELVFEPGNDVDWEALVLSVDGAIVADCIRGGDRHVYVDGVTESDIPDDVWSQMRLPEILNSGEVGNQEHDRKMRETLIDWLMTGDYSLAKDDERGFANEYTMILTETSESVTVTREQAEAWADDYLYRGDAATEAFVGLRIVETSDF